MSTLGQSLGRLAAFERRNVAPKCLAVEFANPFQHVRGHSSFQTMWDSNVYVPDISPSHLAQVGFNALHELL